MPVYISWNLITYFHPLWQRLWINSNIMNYPLKLHVYPNCKIVNWNVLSTMQCQTPTPTKLQNLHGRVRFSLFLFQLCPVFYILPYIHIIQESLTWWYALSSSPDSDVLGWISWIFLALPWKQRIRLPLAHSGWEDWGKFNSRGTFL